MNEDLDIGVDPVENVAEAVPASRSRFSKDRRQQNIRSVAGARAAAKQRRHTVLPSPPKHVDKVKPMPGRVPRRRSRFERLGIRAVALAIGVLAVGTLVHQLTEPGVSKGTIAIERVEADIARQANTLPGGQVIKAGNGQVNEQVVTGDETLVVTGAEASNGKVNPNDVTSANIISLSGGKKLVAGVQFNTQTTSPSDVSVYANSDGRSISTESSSLSAPETAEIAALAKVLLENPNSPPSPEQLPRV